MQPISEILNVLKTKFSDAYVLAASGDVCVETRGRKRGKTSATVLCEAEARAQAREIVSTTDDEIKAALAGLVLFFDFQRQLGERLEEQEILAEIEAEIAAEEAIIEEEAQASDALEGLTPLPQFTYQFFVGLGITTISGLIEALETPAHYAEWGMHAKDACQALGVWTNDAEWLPRAAMAREAGRELEESKPLDPGQFHGADGAEEAHTKAKAEMRKLRATAVVGVSAGPVGLAPVARFVAEGARYARKLDKGTAAEVSALKADIIDRWGEVAARVIAPTLHVSWVTA